MPIIGRVQCPYSAGVDVGAWHSGASLRNSAAAIIRIRHQKRLFDVVRLSSVSYQRVIKPKLHYADLLCRDNKSV